MNTFKCTNKTKLLVFCHRYFFSSFFIVNMHENDVCPKSKDARLIQLVFRVFLRFFSFRNKNANIFWFWIETNCTKICSLYKKNPSKHLLFLFCFHPKSCFIYFSSNNFHYNLSEQASEFCKKSKNSTLKKF